ncbi:Pentatricopeptide repeat [Macleaya cordata]|uniref:Pentatricopeptide repeat n=1 Tax=Macleaya cordata TaxID=56857 RepID=A0A200QMV9_MACCD|nr:Pentatricopeptide repeat [Macleaya cordata]
MECDFFSSEMLSPPSGFHGFLFPIRSISHSRIHFHQGLQKKPRILLCFNRSNSSSLCALKFDETDPSHVVVNGNGMIPSPIRTISNPAMQFKGPHKKPRSCLNSTRLNPSTIAVKDPTTENKFNWDCKETLKKYSGMLQTCASKRSLSDGKAVHGQVIKCGINPDSHLWICLVNMYAKCGSIQFAQKVFDNIPEREVVSWTALIAGYVAAGNGYEGVSLFRQMRIEGILPNGFAFASALKACSLCLALNFGKQMHGEVIKVGLLWDVFVGSALVDLYAKCGEMKFAKGVFFYMPDRNVVSWNALLNGYAQIGDGKEVLTLFHKMIESDIRLSKFTLSSVLKGCGSIGNAREGQAVHSLAIKTGTELDGILSSSLLDMYSKCGLAEDARKIFVRILNPDVVAWSSMIACLDQQGKIYEVTKLFAEMGKKGMRPNQYTLASVVSATADMSDLRYGKSIHACIWKLGFDSDNSVSNALVTMYMKTGSVQDGCRVFEDMKDRDLVSWNAFLSGFHEGDACTQGPVIFNQMLMEGFKPNKYTFISTLRSCSSLSNVSFGQQIHGHIVKNSLEDDGFVGTALVDMYTKCGCLDNAHVIFTRLKERDLFTWTAIISGYAQANQGEKAVKCFRQMQREGVIPNEFTLASCLKGCSSIAALENGRQLHSRVIKSGQSGDVFVISALVDMYGKCGSIEDAEAVFESSVSRDIVSWNTIICGYSQHGHGEKALQAFQSMLDEGITPDEVTFIGVLSACSHVGLIEEGKQHFESLRKVYGLTPTIEHYACMVDILGRAGKLDEVKTFIEKMTVTPNTLIWQTVLGACRMHGNVEFGETAAEKLFELDPKMDSTYILLSNIYAAKGRWDDVAKVRTMMSTQGVKKEPGCSWLEINGQVHIFLAKDGSHPKVKEIHLKLEELDQKLKSAGYVPNTDCVLNNVCDEEKKQSLMYHSERLALSYALISMEPGKPIRIFKNLRICEDCHNVMKLLSDIINREIVIRDVSRFHHFRNGSCSCWDYW